MDGNYCQPNQIPWAESYYSDGKTVFRLYARTWRVGDDPSQDGLWRVVLQPVVNGKVLAEAVQPKDVEWVDKGKEKEWAKRKLGPSFKEIVKKAENLPGRPHNNQGRRSA
jgi:hypothetical protein